ncbi:MAG: glycosyltransferase [Halioglobus sp.]
MKTLRRDWQIVCVVCALDAPYLAEYLHSLRSRSFLPDLLVVAEDDHNVRVILDALAVDAIYVLPAMIPREAFWITLLQHFTPQRDVNIVVRAGVQVPEHWDARLVAAGQRADSAVAVSPVCARHALLTVLSGSARRPGLPVDEMDQWLNDYAQGREFPVPVLLPSCMLLQGPSWRSLPAPVGSDAELAYQLRTAGLSLVATDQVYVDDSHLEYDDGTASLPPPLLDAYLYRSPLAAMRHALSELAERCERPPLMKRCLPVQLHVGHSWGGGLARWMEDFIGADTHHNHLVLRSVGDLSAFGQNIVLYRGADMDVPLQTWSLCEPVLSVSSGSIEYREVLQEIIAAYSVESLVVSSFIGHSLDLLATGLPTTVVMHEFFPFCPALYAMYDSPCHSCTRERLSACGRNNPYNAFFRFDSDDHWMNVRERFAQAVLADNVALVAPSRSVVARYRDLEPRLEGKTVHVVSHGLNDALLESLSRVRSTARPGAAEGERLRVVALGRLTREKGGDIIADACAALAEFADIWLLGTGESGARFTSLPGVTVVSHYESGELGTLLSQIQPDVGLQLSTVPESFSYTLSELWAAGIPVLATPVGALRERIEESGLGWLVTPAAPDLVAALRIMHADRSALDATAILLGRAGMRSSTEMVADYLALEPANGGVPLARYYLPRRSYSNPYGPVGQSSGAYALHINPQRPYRQALEEFLLHTASKADQTPSLPGWLGGALGGGMRWCARRIAAGKRV